MSNGDIIGYVGLTFSVIFFIVCGYRYYRYWNQLKNALTKTGAKWPLHDQAELNKIAREDIPGGYRIISGNIIGAARIIFSMRSDDPNILKPLRGLRRVLIAFILFPFALGFILLIAATIFAY